MASGATKMCRLQIETKSTKKLLVVRPDLIFQHIPGKIRADAGGY